MPSSSRCLSAVWLSPSSASVALVARISQGPKQTFRWSFSRRSQKRAECIGLLAQRAAFEPTVQSAEYVTANTPARAHLESRRQRVGRRAERLTLRRGACSHAVVDVKGESMQYSHTGGRSARPWVAVRRRAGRGLVVRRGLRKQQQERRRGQRRRSRGTRRHQAGFGRRHHGREARLWGRGRDERLGSDHRPVGHLRLRGRVLDLRPACRPSTPRARSSRTSPSRSSRTPTSRSGRSTCDRTSSSRTASPSTPRPPWPRCRASRARS